MDIKVEAADVGGQLTFRGSYGNSTSVPWNSFHAELSGGATWAAPNGDLFPSSQVTGLVVNPTSI